jgi:hypothetical protein
LNFVLIRISIISVSNEVPEQPVLSPVSGCIYEKRLIIKYLHESPNDPITGQPLTEDQLIDVKGIFIDLFFLLLKTFGFF